jgi:hypothetical protein
LRYDGEGNVLLDTRNNHQAPTSVLWSEPLGSHSVENVCDADLHVIGVEIKDP